MLNKVCSFIRQQGLINRGDSVICALSGGADSVALLYALYPVSYTHLTLPTTHTV